MVAIDRWALWRTQQLQDEVIAAYRNYQFHLIYQKVHNFCSVDLGGFYLDVLKDRLYTTPPKSHARRSAQTAMFWIAEAMVRWLAPILSFTAEEIWRFMPGKRAESVFFSTWASVAAGRGERPAIDWDARAASAQRGDARAREAAQCGGRSARRSMRRSMCIARRRLLETLQTFGDELRFVFITSEARVHPAEQRPRMRRGRGGRRQCRVDRRAPERGDEVRALLAQARRRRQRMRRIRSCAAAA